MPTEEKLSKCHVIELMNKKDLDKAFDTIALAFDNYPMYNYVFGNNSKISSIKQVYKSSVTTDKFKCVGIILDGECKAVAIFAKPSFKGVSTVPFLLKGGFKLVLKHSLGVAFRLINYENHAVKIKSKYSDENCWYLYSLTVHPDYQHKGLASKVMQSMLDFFDETGQSCYLETNDDSNVPLYAHLGFKLMEKGFVPKTKIVHCAMKREPKLK